MKRTLVATFAGLFLSATLAACGPPTLQGAESRYKSSKDKLSAIMTRKPQSKDVITAKLAEFQAEFDKAMQEPTEEKKIAAISSLNARIDRFIDDIEPREQKGSGPGAPSDKLDKGAPPAATPPGPAPTPGNKLDAAPPSGAMGGPAADAPSGMGSAPTPAPTPAPASGGGGMGGM